MTNRIIIVLIIGVFGNSINAQTKTAVTSKQAKLVSEINLSDQDIEVFKDQTKQKVDEFQQHIVTIGSKDEPAEKGIWLKKKH